jgi:hypothetical protein
LKYGLLFSIAAILMLLSLFCNPVWYDDAGHFIVARQAAQTGEACYPVTSTDCRPDSPFITMGPALTWPLAAWMALFGAEMGSSRFLMIFLSLLSLAAFGLLAFALLKQHRKVFWALLMVLGNIQWITYGSELLGEVPMLGWVCLGAWAHLNWVESRKATWAVAAAVAWMMAVLVKEYALLVIGLGLICWLGSCWGRQRRQLALGVFLQAGGLLGAYFVYAAIRAGNFADVWAYFQVRQSYGSEFLAFDLHEGFRFLAFKPLILLGTIALVVKVVVKKANVDIFMLCLQGAWLVFFFASAGFDRFGFQLILIPAIYLSEFVAMLSIRWAKTNWLKISLLTMAVLVFSWQQTLTRLPGLCLDGIPTNTAEIEIGRKLNGRGELSLFTFDQQIVPFLPPNVRVHLSENVPSNASKCRVHQPMAGEFFIEGEYGRTIYKDCVERTQWDRLDSVQVQDLRYVLFQAKDQGRP